jgi:hypothetical protein
MTCESFYSIDKCRVFLICSELRSRRGHVFHPPASIKPARESEKLKNSICRRTTYPFSTAIVNFNEIFKKKENPNPNRFSTAILNFNEMASLDEK